MQQDLLLVGSIPLDTPEIRHSAKAHNPENICEVSATEPTGGKTVSRSLEARFELRVTWAAPVGVKDSRVWNK